MGRFWKFFGQNYLKFNLSRGHFYLIDKLAIQTVKYNQPTQNTFLQTSTSFGT